MLTDLAFPSTWQNGSRAIAEAILARDRFLVAAHARLDGDALASIAAMGYFLRLLGKEFVLYAPYGVPSYLSFLPLPGHLADTLGHLPFTPQTLIALDCGTPSRLGEELEEMHAHVASINIDHHPGPGMGSIENLILPDAASTTQILASVCCAAGIQPNADIARSITLGLLTDTGGFRHKNTSREVFALMPFLLECGADVYALREKLDKNWTLAKFRLWGRLFEHIELLADGAVAFCSLTLRDFQETGTLAEDTEGFVEKLRELRGVRIAALVREQDPASCKFSLRCSEGADVRSIAAVLGGGGHVQAAGGMIHLPITEAIEELKKAILQTNPQPIAD